MSRSAWWCNHGEPRSYAEVIFTGCEREVNACRRGDGNANVGQLEVNAYVIDTRGAAAVRSSPCVTHRPEGVLGAKVVRLQESDERSAVLVGDTGVIVPDVRQVRARAAVGVD